MSDFLERVAKLSPKRLALLAMELNSKLERFEQRVAEPIAVTGIGCRFPGGVNDSDSFWRLLIEGRDGISQVPPGRWDINAFYDADPDAPGKMSTRWGGFLSGVEQFDPEFSEFAAGSWLGWTHNSGFYRDRLGGTGRRGTKS
jgi:hypothetical protein